MIETPRLVLRGWRDDDHAPFAALNADAEVMRHFPAAHSREESDALADRNRLHIDDHGWGLWAVERKLDGAFLGFTGLASPRAPNPLAGDVEVGWRLARFAWGHGYASEGPGRRSTSASTNSASPASSVSRRPRTCARRR